MAYYDNSSWPSSGRQGPWDPSSPASRAGNTPTSPNDDGEAFYYQFASVDRAVETWRKGSKMLTDPRMQMGPRFPPNAEFDPLRPMAPGSVQNFYSNQRFGPRPGEADPAMQAKRRMAAQRERDLRNYHQEQQIQKHLSAKSDRSMSPNTGMSEDERRELIARQHRALYGSDSNLYPSEAATSRPISQDVRVTAANPPGSFRGSSPYDSFGIQAGGPSSAPGSAQIKQQGEKEGSAPGQRSRAGSTSSPASNQNQPYGLFESQQQQSSRTSTSSPGGSPPGNAKPPTSNASTVAPIGTRPSAQPQNSGLQKRSTTPLPSPLSYGFSAAQSQGEGAPGNQDEKINNNNNIRGGWGNPGGWSGKGGLGVQAKVWG